MRAARRGKQREAAQQQLVLAALAASGEPREVKRQLETATRLG
jgi:hypothetical protein